MTREEILNMKAGREMDELIAKHIIRLEESHEKGWWWIGGFMEECPDYSYDISAAWDVVEKLGGEDSEYCAYVIGSINNTWRCDFKNAFIEFSAMEETAPLAICRAALLAVIKKDVKVCRYCNGSGKGKNWFNSKCVACDGSGLEREQQ